MKLSDLIKTANRNLLRNKLRTLLTISAIFVGAFTLTMTNAVGDGLKNYIEQQVKNYEGDDVLFVRKIQPRNEEESSGVAEYKEETNSPTEFDKNSETVSLAQIENLAREFPEVESITPNYFTESEYVTLDGVKKYVTRVNAIAKGMTQKVEAGTGISGEGQIILQYDIAKAMNTDFKELIGKFVTLGYKTGNSGQIQTIQLRVVGVATKGFMASFSSSIDSGTEKKIYEAQQIGKEDYNKFYGFSFQLKTKDEKKIAELTKKLTEKGFQSETYADQNRRAYDAIGIFQIIMNLFAFIALLAASFGIINTLVIAVMERTKEIGLQKALGMSKFKIFFLFSLESVLIGFWGAVSGIVAAIFLGLAANFLASTYYLKSFEGYSFVVFTPSSIIFVTLLVCGIAFFAGVLPAFRAARLNPIEALRYE